MTRVSHPSSHRGAQGLAALDRARAGAARKKKPYKILLEAVTQEKRKLKATTSYTIDAPHGFGYIPVGHPEFTEWCKEQCRQRSLDVHVVSAHPKNRIHHDENKISHHVHRIGHHFPLEIIRLACTRFGYTFDEEKNDLKKLRTAGQDFIAQYMEDYNQRQRLHGRPASAAETKEHISGAVREMFPKIPEADLASIVNHAFQEGTGRVGNAKELPLARRVQLAVVAHIRHTYTDYDKMLKTGSWTEARKGVEHVSLAKLLEWRDEADADSNELEDTFREVIVLDDDEDESSDENTSPEGDERETSMEIISSRATARDLQPELVNGSRRPVRFMGYGGRAARRTIVLEPVPSPSRSSVVSGPSYAHPPVSVAPALCRLPPPPAIQQPLKFHPESFRLAHTRPLDSRARTRTYEPVPRDSPLQMRDSNGQLYNLQPIEESREHPRTTRTDGPSRVQYIPPSGPATRYAPEGYVSTPPRVNSFDGHQPGRQQVAPSSRRASEQDLVLPSIEHEADGVTSPRRVPDATHQLQHPSHSYADVQSPKRKTFPTAVYGTVRNSEHAPKRLKPADSGDHAYTQFESSQTGLSRQVRDYEPMDISSRPRAEPRYEMIDLISSPARPPHSRDREVYDPERPRATAGPSKPSYVLAPSREPLRGDVRGAYFEAPVGESSRAYIPEHDRMYERRVVVPREYVAMREEPLRHPDVAETRYLRSGANYGGYTLH